MDMFISTLRDKNGRKTIFPQPSKGFLVWVFPFHRLGQDHSTLAQSSAALSSMKDSYFGDVSVTFRFTETLRQLRAPLLTLRFQGIPLLVRQIQPSLTSEAL